MFVENKLFLCSESKIFLRGLELFLGGKAVIWGRGLNPPVNLSMLTINYDSHKNNK